MACNDARLTLATTRADVENVSRECHTTCASINACLEQGVPARDCDRICGAVRIDVERYGEGCGSAYGDYYACLNSQPCADFGSRTCPDQLISIYDTECTCCLPDDPCGWANDESCDCPSLAWEQDDCADGGDTDNCCVDGDPCGWANDMVCDCGDQTWDVVDCGLNFPFP